MLANRGRSTCALVGWRDIIAFCFSSRAVVAYHPTVGLATMTPGASDTPGVFLFSLKIMDARDGAESDIRRVRLDADERLDR